MHISAAYLVSLEIYGAILWGFSGGIHLWSFIMFCAAVQFAASHAGKPEDIHKFECCQKAEVEKLESSVEMEKQKVERLMLSTVLN